MNYGMVRSGGNIFGVTSDDFTQSFDLYARVLQITRAEECLNHFGYNSTFKSTELKRIAILGFGYADGYPRLLSNKGEVFFKKRLSIIGTISMDYTIVDISTLDIGQIKVGDWVELIGENINIKEISKKSQTIPYEILINICSRAKKQYIG
jgi:alanine racemase